MGLRVLFTLPALESHLFANDDLSWRRRWVRRQQQEGIPLYYSFDRHDPLLGWFSKPNLRDRRVFEDETLNTNSRGLRGRQEFPYERTPGKPRLLLLGDSFTFGDEVSDDETYAHQLQRLLPKAEILNMGVHGYGHDQMLLLLREEGRRYEPDVVLLGFLPLDMARNVVGFRDFAKPRFRIADDRLVLEGTPVPPPEEVLRWDWLRPRILDAFSLLRVGWATRSGSRQAEEQVITWRILDAIVDEAKAIGATPVIAYLPYGPELHQPAEVRTPGEELLFAYCEERRDALCFSTRPAFWKQVSSGRTFASIFHWDAAGHRTVAEAIFDFVVRKNRLLRATDARRAPPAS